MVEAAYALIQPLPRWNYRTPLFRLPFNGIYLFFERGEAVEWQGQIIPRIVRVGTHVGDGNFPSRIRQHYGNVNSLSGNKNGSVFRMHLGAALMAQANPRDPRIKSWLTHMDPTFPDVEAQVSLTMRERFSFVCFRVDTKAERLSLESGLIALLASFSMAALSSRWLGKHAVSPEIRSSGLWNVQKLDDVPLTGTQFRRLEQLVADSLRE